MKFQDSSDKNHAPSDVGGMLLGYQRTLSGCIFNIVRFGIFSWNNTYRFSRCRMIRFSVLRRNKAGNQYLIILMYLILMLTGCGSRDYILEYKASNKLEEFRENNNETMSLNDLFGSDWRKVCLQWTYGLKKDLEKEFNENLPTEIALGPNDNALWVFYKNGSEKVVVINRNLMDYQYFPRVGTLCTSPASPYLFASETDDIKRFYFLDK